jgi:beta-1,3-galactosyltransferase 2
MTKLTIRRLFFQLVGLSIAASLFLYSSLDALSPDDGDKDSWLTAPRFANHTLTSTFLIDTFTVSHENYTFRYSPKFLRAIDEQAGTRSPSDGLPNVMFGIISHPKQLDRRDAIRASWARHESVLFVVAGTWTHEIASEFFEFNDIIFLEAEEDYRTGLTRKTMVLIHFFASQLSFTNLNYVFKTDDDCYVNTTQIRLDLNETNPYSKEPIEYYGHAHLRVEPIRHKESKFYLSQEEYPRRFFPTYATGLGYAVSTKFASCAKEKMKSSRKMLWEDVATGALARKCSIKLTFANWTILNNETHGIYFPYELYKDGGAHASIVHAVKPSYMLKLHGQEPLELKETFLQVPFYVYDNELNWANATFEGVPISDSWYPTFKHADDYWFLQSALQHPMRTIDPSKAKLFFVPVLFNANSEANRNVNSSPPNFCVHGKCSTPGTNHQLDLMRWANELLGESKFFRRSEGRDHIIVASHYDQLELFEKPIFRNIRRCGLVRFENFQKICFLGARTCAKIMAKPNPKRLKVDPHFLPKVSIPSLYVGRACPVEAKKTADFAMVAFLEGKQARQNICDWLKRGNYSVSLCGEGEQCQALSRAKYGFHARGDTFGSNRLMDTLLSGTVPLFTDEKQYEILPNFMPWKNMSYFVNVSSFEEFSKSLEEILMQPEYLYGDKQKLIAEYRDWFNYSSGVPFDRYMAGFATLSVFL